MYFSVRRIVLSLLNKDTWNKALHSDVIVVRHDFNCGYIYKNKAFAQLSDTLIDIFKKHNITCQAVAQPFSFLVGEKAYHPPITVNRIFFILLLKYFFSRLIMPKKRAQGKFIINQKNLWIDVILNTKARLVVSLNLNSPIAMASKETETLFYIMQHGTLTKDQKTLLDLSNAFQSKLSLPTGFLCWDTETENLLENLNITNFDVRAIGNVWILRHFFVEYEDDLVRESQDDLKEIPFLNNGRTNILVSLQWGMRELFRVNNNTMTFALVDTIKCTSHEFNWLIRLHPTTLRGYQKSEVLKFLKNTFSGIPNIEWEIVSQSSLPSLLKQTDLHITYSSSTTIEAGYIGIHTAILNPLVANGGKMANYYLKERREGLAEVVTDNAESIKKWMQRNKTTQKDLSNIEILIRNLNAFIEFVKMSLNSNHFKGNC